MSGWVRGTTPFIGKCITQFDQKKCEHKICLVEDWTHDPRIACGRSNHNFKPCRLAKEQRTRYSCHPAALQIAHVLPFLLSPCFTKRARNTLANASNGTVNPIWSLPPGQKITSKWVATSRTGSFSTTESRYISTLDSQSLASLPYSLGLP